MCYSYALEEERAAGQAPDVLDIPTSVPRVRGAVTEVTWKLPLHDGAGDCPVKAGWSTLKTEHRQKFIWTRRNVNMEKNDIFNTNLLQLPMKAQVADEGVVQDIASVAEHSFQIGYSSAMQTFAEAAAALEAKANVQQ